MFMLLQYRKTTKLHHVLGFPKGHRATPSHHPFRTMGFSTQKKHTNIWDVPMTIWVTGYPSSSMGFSNWSPGWVPGARLLVCLDRTSLETGRAIFLEEWQWGRKKRWLFMGLKGVKQCDFHVTQWDWMGVFFSEYSWVNGISTGFSGNYFWFSAGLNLGFLHDPWAGKS